MGALGNCLAGAWQGAWMVVGSRLGWCLEFDAVLHQLRCDFSHAPMMNAVTHWRNASRALLWPIANRHTSVYKCRWNPSQSKRRNGVELRSIERTEDYNFRWKQTQSKQHDGLEVATNFIADDDNKLHKSNNAVALI